MSTSRRSFLTRAIALAALYTFPFRRAVAAPIRRGRKRDTVPNLLEQLQVYYAGDTPFADACGAVDVLTNSTGLATWLSTHPDEAAAVSSLQALLPDSMAAIQFPNSGETAVSSIAEPILISFYTPPGDG